MGENIETKKTCYACPFDVQADCNKCSISSGFTIGFDRSPDPTIESLWLQRLRSRYLRERVDESWRYLKTVIDAHIDKLQSQDRFSEVYELEQHKGWVEAALRKAGYGQPDITGGM